MKLPYVSQCGLIQQKDYGVKKFFETPFEIDFSKIANAKGDFGTFDSLANDLGESMKKECGDALMDAENILDTCDCKVPGLKEVLTVVSLVACFPADAQVSTPAGNKSMSELNVGDCVLSKHPNGTVETCDPIYMFGHAEHNVEQL